MSRDDELAALREEVETLAEFLYTLQREYAQLHRDFAAVVHASGGAITAATEATVPAAPGIVRIYDPETGTTTFRLAE